MGQQATTIHTRPTADRTAKAFRVAARLEMYEAHLRTLRGDWRDPAVWRLATHEIKELVATSRSLPQLAEDMIELARQHLELLSALTGPGDAPPAAHRIDQIQSAVESLHRKCLAVVRH